MDSLPALPPDLAALADPSVRGAASLLVPVDSEHVEALGTTPFASCLALLTTPLPSGEAMPPAGKDLPVVSLGAAADSAPSIADLMLALAPAAAAVQAQLWPAQSVVLPADALPASPLPAVVAAAVTSETTPASSPVMPEALVGAPLDSAPALASPSAAADAAAAMQSPADVAPEAPLDGLAAPDAAVASETAQLRATDSGAKSLADAARLDGLTADDRRFERMAAQRPEPRVSGAPVPPQLAAAVPQYQAVAAAATPTAEVGAAAQNAARRGELQKIVLPAGASGDSAGVVQTDWLPASGTSGITTHAVTAPSHATPGAPVDTRTPTWHDAFASRVQWLVDHNVGEAHIKLNPPELGAVDVKISLVDDKTFVQLTTATAAARDELSQSLPRLRELLAGSGLELGGASVQSGRDGQQSAFGQGQGGTGGAPEPLWRAPFSTGADELPRGSPRSSRGRIDVFA